MDSDRACGAAGRDSRSAVGLALEDLRRRAEDEEGVGRDEDDGEGGLDEEVKLQAGGDGHQAHDPREHRVGLAAAARILQHLHDDLLALGLGEVLAGRGRERERGRQRRRHGGGGGGPRRRA